MVGTRSVVAGIDPGLSGACAFLCEITNRIIGVADLPLRETPEGNRELDQFAFSALLEQFNPRLVAIELVQGFGGVSSAFKLGASYGSLIVTVLSGRFRLERVRPRVWQSTIFPLYLGTSHEYDTKAASVYIANKCHPEADLIRGKGKKLNHDRADAVNIACFASKVFRPTTLASPERTRKEGK